MIAGRLERHKKIVDKELAGYLPQRSQYPQVIHEAMRYSVLNGGKRLRPFLLVESCRLCGGSEKKALPFACAIELIHSYSLIHDDMPSMDNADTRRSRPACHKKYGEAIALLAGDGLLTLAFNVMARQKHTAGLADIIFEISKAIGSFGMVGGQVMDLQAKNQKKIDLPLIEYINLHKTASLIAAAARIGAMVGGGNVRQIDALRKYGEYTGLAFQIVDDILDRDGYAEVFGTSGAADEARRFVERAKGLLDIFGRKADSLRSFADHVMTRKK